MKRIILGVAALAVFAGIASPQDKPKDEKKLVFNFKDTSAEVVLQYVCKELNWTLVYGEKAKPEGTVTAWSDSAIPESKVIDFLNTALAKSKVQVVLLAGVLKVITEEDARKGTYNIFYGCDPAEITPNDTMRTQIIPLKNMNVVDISKELKTILDDAASKWAINTYSNAIVVTEKASTIYRLVRIFKVLDVQAADRLKVTVFSLKYADATETSKLLNELFKKEQQAQGRGGPFGEMMRMFGGGGGGGGGDRGPTAKTLATELVRITADIRTNSVVASATEDNMKIIKETIDQLDTEKGEAIKLKLYPLRYADAQAAATLITQIFADEQKASANNNRNRNPFQFNPFGGGAQPTDPSGQSREVKAVADVRTNSVLVAGNELNLKIVDQLVTELDRQLSDVLQVKVFKLKNAQASGMATILQAVFRPQVTATQNAGRTTGNNNQGGGGMQMFGGQNRGGSTSTTLSPAQEVEITSDTRTNSIIIKASEDYIAIAEELIKQLDEDPTEQYSTYVIPLDNANASDVATILQNLLRGNTGTGQNRAGTTQGQLPGIGGQTGQGAARNSQAGSARGTGGTGGTGGRTGSRNLGPLGQEQDPSLPQDNLPQEEPQDRRGIEGQVDVQADTATNQLVVRTSPRNFESIQNIVKGLDKMRPQVLIKVLIAEVTLDDNLNFGVEGFWENKFRVNGDAITQRYGTDFNLATAGLTSTFTGDELQANLNALAQEGKLKVLATPRILVLDNQTANINVGKDVPRVTNSTINQQGNTVNTVTYESLGIKLAVTPHINFDGLVTMEVAPEISDIAPASQSVTITQGVTSPTFFVNQAQTVVAARTGQTIAIGGLIRDSIEDSVEKIPILGDIPIIGLAFSNTVKKHQKKELMIFLTPYVAYNSAQLQEITELEKSKCKLLDRRDIDAEGDKWLDRMKLGK